MTEVKVGDAYVAKRVYTGRNESGPWELIVVQNVGKKQPKIGVSVLNVPSKIGPNGVFKITSIKSVQHRKWKDGSGRWQDGNVTVRARVKALAQMAPEELEEVSYKEHAPEFPTIEELFGS